MGTKLVGVSSIASKYKHIIDVNSKFLAINKKNLFIFDMLHPTLHTNSIKQASNNYYLMNVIN